MRIPFKSLNSKQVFIILLVLVILLLVIRYTNRSYTTTSPSITQNQSLSPTQAPTVVVSTTPQTAASSLSTSDIEAKNSLLLRILHGDQSGIVYQSSNVQIQYIATDNIFQAEILTTQITAAKSDAENWFQSQGISQNGECQLLIFYINPAIKAPITSLESQASILPDGC